MIDWCLKWDPSARLTAHELLKAPFFLDCEEALERLKVLSRFKINKETLHSETVKLPVKTVTTNHIENSNVPYDVNELNLTVAAKYSSVRKSFPITVESSRNVTRELPVSSLETGSMSKKLRSEYPKLSVPLSTSPLRIPMLATPSFDKFAQKRTERGKIEFPGSKFSMKMPPPALIKDLVRKEAVTIPELESSPEQLDETSSANTPDSNNGSALDKKSNNPTRASTQDTFYTAKTSLSIPEMIDDPQKVTQMDIDDTSENFENALQRIDNIITVLSTPITTGLEHEYEQKDLSEKKTFRDFKKDSINVLEETDKSTDSAIERLSKFLSSSGSS